LLKKKSDSLFALFNGALVWKKNKMLIFKRCSSRKSEK